MTPADILLVGPADKKTGGIAYYIKNQQNYLSEHLDCDIFDVSTSDGSGLQWFVTACLEALRDMVGFVRRSPPQLVHIHSSQDLSFYLSSFYILFVSYAWQRPVVLHIHGPSFDEFVMTSSQPLFYFQQFVLNRCDNVIVLSEYWKKTLELRLNKEKLCIVPNAVNPANFSPRTSFSVQQVVFLADTIQRKGLKEFIEAITTLNGRENLQFRVAIAGTGPLSSLADELAEEYQNIQYHGYISEEQKYRLLSSSSIYVLPSHADGLPISLLEAMAGGNAIVTTPVGSIPNLIDGENGRIVSVDDTNELIDTLESLLTSPQIVEQMSEENIREVQKSYTWQQTVQDLMEIYQQFLNNTPKT